MRVNIPTHARVTCADGDAGTSRALIVDPVQRRLTHLVVREHHLADSERLVPIGLLDEASEDAISLRCTRDELHDLEDFIEAHFVDTPYAAPAASPSYERSTPLPIAVSKRIPKGEVVLRRHSAVEATDYFVGYVESIIVDTADDRITHVVMRTTRFLSRQEVAVPVADVKRLVTDYVFLTLNLREVDSLPHVPHHEAYLLPALRSADEDLVPEAPKDAGMGGAQVDASHVEGAHLLADDMRTRLRARGFTNEQILDWAEAFLGSERSGGDAEFHAWIRKKEQAAKPGGGLSGGSAAPEHRQPIQKAH